MGLYSSDNFNSHAHVERDANTGTISTSMTHFNSHAHVERDLEKSIQCNHLQISTHTLTWSVTEISIGMPFFCNNFNSHAHVERDAVVENGGLDRDISTHTLTWSVTP